MQRSPYGWVVVLCAFTLMFVGFGAAYSFAAFFRAFQSEFSASRAHVCLVFSLCAFLYFLLGAPGNLLGPPLAAWWIEALGWRGAYLALAACTLVLGGAAAAAIRNRPA